MFWKKKRSRARQAVDEATQTATDLAEKSLVIGWGGVALLVGVAALGAAATYVAAKQRQNRGAQNRKAAPKGGFSGKS